MRIPWHDKNKTPRQTRRSLDNATEKNAEETRVKTHSPFRAGQRVRGQQYLEVGLFTLPGLLQLQSHVFFNVLLIRGGVAQRRARGQNKPPMTYYWAGRGLLQLFFCHKMNITLNPSSVPKSVSAVLEG